MEYVVGGEVRAGGGDVETVKRYLVVRDRGVAYTKLNYETTAEIVI